MSEHDQLTPERLAELRRVAEAATPGPWAVNPFKATVDEMPSMLPICGLLWPTDQRTEEQTLANATHIATFDPATVIAILDEIERLRRERETLAAAVRGGEGARGTTRYLLHSSDYSTWACEADDCDALWYLEDGTPSENRMRYCPGCGRRIVAEVRDVEEQEAEDGEDDA